MSSPSDGLIHVGDAVCIMHVPTQSVISAYMSAAQAHEAKQLISNCNVSCSKRLQPCPRNIFIVGRYNIISIILLPRSLRLSDHFGVGINTVMMSFSACIEKLRIGLGNEADHMPNATSKHI